jgi:hypothetical protein
MGVLYLVRHAQASFLEPNYDKLSTLGETQARVLGNIGRSVKSHSTALALVPARGRKTL